MKIAVTVTVTGQRDLGLVPGVSGAGAWAGRADLWHQGGSQCRDRPQCLINQDCFAPPTLPPHSSEAGALDCHRDEVKANVRQCAW
jgi:hypothetical protein